MLRICQSCQSPFRPNPKVPNQEYCSNDACQKERRRRWQRQKRQNDVDYRKNQYEAQKTWCQKNPHYWRRYRKEHPGYAERNRRLQKIRYAKSKIASQQMECEIPRIAKMDVLNQKYNINTGHYMLYPVHLGKIAKMDALLVKIVVIPTG
jgi:hypothetical protein